MDQVMTAGTNLAAIVPEVWSAKYYDVLLAELPFESLIDRGYEGAIQDVGDIVNISSFPEFSEGDDLDEDARADAEAVTISGQQLVIDSRIVKDFIITKTALTQSLPAMDKLRDMAIYAVMKRIQSKIIAKVVPSAAAPDNTLAYTSGTTLALADILNAKEALDGQNVPMADRHMVLGSAQMNDIFNIVGFTSSDFLLSGAPLQTGEVPSGLVGFAPHMTTVVGNTSYFFHRSFMTIAAQEGMTVELFNLGVEGKRATRVNVGTLIGIKQLDNKRVVTIS